MRPTIALALAAVLFPAVASAQGVDGYVSIVAATLPDVPLDDGSEVAGAELRARVEAAYRGDLGGRIHLTASAFVETLVGRRLTAGVTQAATVRPQDLHLEMRWRRADLRAGFSRVAWGRLDEFQPTDVVNPLDLTRFFFEGRSEARLPVAMVRARWLPSDRVTLEGIYVPFFRAGRFDQLDEAGAPFNVTPQGVSWIRREPARTVDNAQGGMRALVTTGRVDWALSAYRGFASQPIAAPGFEELYPRFTMLGGDFETVKGAWGFRGEAAAFVERTLQAGDGTLVSGEGFEGGLGLDRKAGAYRVGANVVYAVSALRDDVMLVGGIDRAFARETRTVRVFAAYNPGERSTFGRVLATFSLRDNLALEASAGVFSGGGADALARFAGRDFLRVGVKAFF
jgi:hypothetical protein